MANKHKLEFLRFKLKPINSSRMMTFRNFACDNLNVDPKASNDELFGSLFTYFIQSFEKEYSKNDRLKKSLMIEKKQEINDYFNFAPSFNSAKQLIHGVINGGTYGKDRISKDVTDKDSESDKVDKNKAIYLYYFVFIYLPLDHDEGFFMINSNSSEETITSMFRKFMEEMFALGNYKKPQTKSFCPKYFQDEFKRGAILKKITFNNSYNSSPIESDSPDEETNFEVSISLKPNKPISLEVAKRIKKAFDILWFGDFEDKSYMLGESRTVSVDASNNATGSSKKFSWSAIDDEFTPVVYLDNQVRIDENGNPDYEELKKYCLELFNDTILKEIRPDLFNVSRTD